VGSLAGDQNIAIRTRVVLPIHAIAKGLGFSRLTVLSWQRRFKAIRVAWIDVRCSSIWARRKLMPEQVKAAVKATAHPPPTEALHKSQTIEPLPPSIELSPVQREILDLIVQDQTSIQGPVQPERAILLWSDGISESATARELGISEEAVRSLLHRWLASTVRIAAAEKKVQKAFTDLVSLIFRIPSEEPPPEATPDSPAGAAQTSSARAGNPTVASELRPATRALIEILHHKPSAYGINRSNWTQASLADAFGKLYCQRPSKSTVSRLLKQAGLRWKKSRKVLTSPDPNYREKVELLLRTLHSLKADEDLFFIDELGPLQVRRYGARCYTPKGQTPTYPQNQRSKGSITLYGALSAITNQVIWLYGSTKDSAGIIDLAEILFNQYHNKSRIYLTWDAASWHRSNALVEWADAFNTVNKANRSGPIIEVVSLPASAQFLNVIEAVFSAMKRAVIHSSDYQSEDGMKIAISTHFRERNEFFKHHPRRAGKKIWEIDFFKDYNHIRSGNYREW
jgi:transposase